MKITTASLLALSAAAVNARFVEQHEQNQVTINAADNEKYLLELAPGETKWYVSCLSVFGNFGGRTKLLRQVFRATDLELQPFDSKDGPWLSRDSPKAYANDLVGRQKRRSGSCDE
jgi:hypothetical protein